MLEMKKIQILWKCLYICVLSFAMISAYAQKEILLWPNGAPGSEGKTGEEKVSTSARGEISISNVHRPSITPYLPALGKATGVAVIIAPGGGHTSLKMDYEGSNLAKWLNERGVAAFVLKYRLAKEAGSTYTIDDHALADMQRAIRVVRSRAKEWNIDTARIGVLGYSAGGELAGLAAMRFDNGKENATDVVERQHSRPNFQVLVYPGGITRFEPVRNSPPLFIVGGYGDRDEIAKGMAQVYLKYKEAGIPAELHIYAKAVHGFGVRENTQGAVAGWPSRFYEWLIDMGFLKK
ncbi:MAG: alpha/beta hydrolase [Flavisolibacter sp.]|nr:alpha/beta hydrolase [Flavisolibacter sp.]